MFVSDLLLLVVLLPDVRHEDLVSRLQRVAKFAEQMRAALVKAIGILWRGDSDLRSDLDSIMKLLKRAPHQLLDWQFSVAYEGAC